MARARRGGTDAMGVPDPTVRFSADLAPLARGGVIPRAQIPTIAGLDAEYRYVLNVCVQDPSTGEFGFRRIELDSATQIRDYNLAAITESLLQSASSATYRHGRRQDLGSGPISCGATIERIFRRA